MSRRRIRYAPPRGPVAIAPKAWGEEFDVLFGLPGDEPRALYTEEGDYAVVTIEGPLFHKATFWGDSYEQIANRVRAALDSDKPSVCLRIASPGGDFVGCLELARDLRAMAELAGKRLVAFTDIEALSAAYALATAADRIVATETASVGAIGVWAPRVDVSAQDIAMGIRVAIASSGPAKADRNPHVPITDESLTRLQAQVDQQADLFFELVSEHRKLPVSRIRALGGADVFGMPALAAGLVDALVNSWSGFVQSDPKEATMSGKPKASKYMDEAKVALRRMAEGDDEEEKKAAEKCLKALEPEEEKKEEKEGESEGEAESESEGEVAEGKKAEGKRGEGKAEGKPIDNDGDKDDKAKKAKALVAGSNELTLAQEVAQQRAELEALRAERAAEKEAEARGKLYASRPDLSAAQRKALDRISLADAKAMIEAMPRVTATPGAAANAMFPAAAGEPRKTYVPNLTPAEQAILAKLDAKPSGAARAEQVGATLQMPKQMTQAQAAAYAKELESELEGMVIR